MMKNNNFSTINYVDNQAIADWFCIKIDAIGIVNSEPFICKKNERNNPQ